MYIPVLSFPKQNQYQNINFLGFILDVLLIKDVFQMVKQQVSYLFYSNEEI